MKILSFSPFLIVSENGDYRVTKPRPNLNVGEIAVKINLEVPESVFAAPSFEATLRVSEEAAAPPALSQETITNTRQAIEASTGYKVKLTIAEGEDDS